MSSIQLLGDTSGSIVVAAPAVAGSGTLTLPTGTATLGIAGPAFSAYQSSAQTISNSTWTKLQFQTKEWDTANCFDATTNYRFTPNVAGYYQVNMALSYGPGTNSEFTTALYKNGSNYKYFWDLTTTWYLVNGSVTVYLNGTTDYIELYMVQYSGSSKTLTASSQTTYFQATLLRGA